MPHKCTNCGRAFADGSKEMLSGCPDCGGNKFQFRPSGSSPDETTASGSVSENSTAKKGRTDTTSNAGAVGRAASTVKGWVGSNDRTEDTQSGGSRNQQSKSSQSRPEKPASEESTSGKPSGRERKQPATRTPADESQSDSSAPVQSGEDRAQASARAEIVPEDELPEKPTEEGTGTVVEAPNDNQPSLDELREELNSQFESIKVVNPGQYELNLMELYERDEYIIALKENGRYVIQVPDSWAGSPNS